MDINKRLIRAKDHDSSHISMWISNEEERSRQNEQLLTLHKRKLELLNGENTSSPVQASYQILESKRSTLSNHLSEAERREEEARKVKK